MTVLSQEQRATSLEAMTSQKFDVLVIGGGVTGAGIALDAAARGLSTAVVDAQDWAAGTSSRSSRLVHGGLRYLYNLDFKLVAEALRERGRLLTTIAPHLVEAQPFLWPLKTPVIERAYSAVGVGMYDALARIGSKGRKTVPIQRHLSKAGAMRRFPEIKRNALVGAIEFYDARVDDARLVITLIRTAVKYGAAAASRVKVTEVLKDGRGRACGVKAVDLENGNEFTIEADRIINATGVWTEQTQELAGGTGGLKVLTSKGIHIVIPRERLKATTGLFLRTEKSVLFIIPWQHYWVIGTTDTAWHEQLKHPVPTSEDIDYVLDHANEVLDPRRHHRHLRRAAAAAPAEGARRVEVDEGLARTHRHRGDPGHGGHRRRQAHHLPGDGRGRRQLRPGTVPREGAALGDGAAAAAGC